MKQKDFPGLDHFIKIINPRVDMRGPTECLGDTVRMNDSGTNNLIHLTEHVSHSRKVCILYLLFRKRYILNKRNSLIPFFFFFLRHLNVKSGAISGFLNTCMCGFFFLSTF